MNPYTTIEAIEIFLNAPNGTINLTSLYNSLNVYEDIFLNFMSAKLVIIDTHDIIKNGPIIGGESVKIIVKTKSEEKIWNFVCYKLEKDLSTKQSESNKNLFILYLISFGGFINFFKKPCKKFSGTSSELVKNVVRNILEDSKTPLIIENSTTSLEFISNFWDPSKILNYIAKHTFNDNHDFLFYENRFGYNFKSISSMMSEETFEELDYKNNSEVFFDENSIILYEIGKYFNFSDMFKEGSLGNTVYKFDDIYYKFDVKRQNHESITEFQTNLGKNSSINSNLITNNGTIRVSYADDLDHSTKRELILKLMNKYHILVKVNGKLNRTVDQIYLIKYLSKRKEDPDKINLLLSGKWLAVQLKHEIVNGVYTQTMKLVKNSFMNSNNSFLTNSKGILNI